MPHSVRQKRGLPPGTLVYTGSEPPKDSTYTVTIYDADHLEVREGCTVDEAIHAHREKGVTWVDVVGLSDTEGIAKLCEETGIHALAQEDIVQPGSRPKVEDYPGVLFLVVKTLQLVDRGDEVEVVIDHVSFVLGDDWLLTFQEREGDPFDPVRHRLAHGIGRIRQGEADYLCYALIDAVVDNYFVLVEDLSEDVDQLEDLLVVSTPEDALERIRTLRTAALMVRKSVLPLRDAIAGLRLESRSHLVSDDLQPYLRDLQDHVAQVLDGVELQRERIMGMIDLYHTGMAAKLNDIMKLLTVISTIFIPLTFITGLYGMNLVMPETSWPGTYPMVLGVMLTMSLMLGWFFKDRGWF